MTIRLIDVIGPPLLVVVGLMIAVRAFNMVRSGQPPNDDMAVGQWLINLNHINSLLRRPMQSRPSQRQVRALGFCFLIAGLATFSYGAIRVVELVWPR